MTAFSSSRQAHADLPASPAKRVVTGFHEHFGHEATVVAQAPGRVNLIGEHTDYNEGFVLPAAIDFHTVIALRPREDRLVRAVALDFGRDSLAFTLDDLDGVEGWGAYLRGAFAVLLRSGHALRGMDIAIAGDVPRGAGLSSSASLLVALITAMRESEALSGLDPVSVAIAARAVETDFVGVQCGIMDQMISACGEAGRALLIDCRSLAPRAVTLHPSLSVLVAHSGVERGLVESAYNDRREECARAAAYFGVAALRDLPPEALAEAPAGLDGVAWKRARHVMTENQRTLDAARVLADGDTQALRHLLSSSHASMRDDFEITTPKVDELVALLQGALGDGGGARMTGGGFGGCVVAVGAHEAIARARRAVMEQYRAPNGVPILAFVCTPVAGACVLRKPG